MSYYSSDITSCSLASQTLYEKRNVVGARDCKFLPSTMTVVDIMMSVMLQDVVVGLKFGSFGREEGALLLVTQGGALIVKMLKRTASLEAKDPNPGPPKGQLAKLNIPKKTKVFVDQTIRERENSIGE